MNSDSPGIIDADAEGEPIPDLGGLAAAPQSARTKAERFEDGVRLYRWTGEWTILVASGLWLAACGVAIAVALDVGPGGLNAADLAWVAAPALGMLVGGVFALVQVFGHEEITLTTAGMTHSKGVRIDRSYVVPLDEVIRVHTVQTSDQPPLTVLRIETLGRPVDFGAGTTAAERFWLRDLLEDWFSHFDIPREQARQPMLVPFPEGETSPIEGRFIVTVSEPRATQPSTSRLRLEDDGRDIELTLGWLTVKEWLWRIVAYSGPAIGWTLALIFAWWDFAPWFFRVLFVLMSLGLAVPSLLALVHPFRKRTRSFTASTWARAWTLGVFGHTRTTELPELLRLELRIEEPEASPGKAASSTWGLHYVGLDGESVAAVEGLTFGEARWLGEHVLDRFGDAWRARPPVTTADESA